jgi:cell division protein FtsL
LVFTGKDYVNNGSSALQPKKKPIWDNDRELKKAENEKQKVLKQLKLKNQALVIFSITLLFMLGSTVIYRYSKIYTMQNALIASSTSAQNIEKDNENLHFQLIQYNRVSVVQDNATKLNMVPTDKSQEVSLDYDKQTLNAGESSEKSQNKQPFFNKIIDAIIK